MDAKRKNVRNFTNLGTVLRDILPRYRLATPPAMTAVWDIWEQAVGADIAANARPAAFKGEILLIHVANSAWLHQLRYLQKDIVAKVNQSLGEQRVRELKFKIGPV